MDSTDGSSSSKKQPPRSTGASQRAAEINRAMLNVPGYADDSMLFMMRYGAMAKETLRKVDWDEFMTRLSAMNSHWFESKCKSSSVGCRGTGEGDGANADAGSDLKDSPDDAVDPPAAASAPEAASSSWNPEPEPEPGSKAAELKARTLELVQDFPHLVRDFDKFVECTRIMATRYKR